MNPTVSSEGREVWVRSARTDLVYLGILLCVLWVARYWHLASFGLYEDDLTIIPSTWGMSFGELGSVVGDYIARLSGHGRPLSDGFIYVFSWLGWRAGHLAGTYVIGLMIVFANTALFYFLVRKRFAAQTAFLCGLAYVLFSADTTQAFLTHSLGLQPSLTLVLLGFHAYSSRRRWVAYLLAAVLLFSYESPYLLLLGAPVLVWGFSHQAVRRLPVHIATLLLLLLGAFLLRRELGDDRVAGLTPTETAATALQHAAVGPLVSLGSYPLRVGQFVLDPRLDGGVAAAIVLAGITLALRWIEPPLLVGKDDPDVGSPALLTLAATGLVLLVLAYPLTFTTRETAISGRETRVHLAAVVGSAMVVGAGARGVLLLTRGRLGGWLGPAAVGISFGLLAGYGFVLQHDYRLAWQLQRQFWSELLPQIDDASEGTVVMVDPEGLVDTLQIGANTWNLPRVLEQLRRLPQEWGTPPRVFRGLADWREYLILPDGSLRINGDTTMSPEGTHTTTTWSRLIVIETQDGVERRLRPLIIDAEPYPLAEPGGGVLDEYPTTLLYDLLVGPTTREPGE